MRFIMLFNRNNISSGIIKNWGIALLKPFSHSSLRSTGYWLLSTILLSSCDSSTSDGTKIPPLPQAFASKRHEAAIALLTDALDDNPRSHEILFKRASIFLNDGRSQEALADIENAISIRGNIGKYYLVKAHVLRSLNRLTDALESAGKAEILNVETPELYTLLGDLYQSDRQYPKALAYLNQSLQITPDNGEAYYYKGLIAAKQVDTTMALSLLQQSLTLKPSFLFSYQMLSEIHNQLKEYPTALYYSKKGLSFHPKNSQLYYLQGLTYQRTWRIDSALICYRQAVKFQPNHVQANFNAGLLYFKMGDLVAALRYFEQTLKANDKAPLINYFIGQCMEYLGRAEEAKNFYEFAMKQSPADYKAQSGYWRMVGRLNAARNNAVPLATTSQPYTPVKIPQKTLDTATIRVQSLTPKSKLNTKSDSLLNKHINTLKKIN